jgi:hypothetical protein
MKGTIDAKPFEDSVCLSIFFSKGIAHQMVMPQKLLQVHVENCLGGFELLRPLGHKQKRWIGSIQSQLIHLLRASRQVDHQDVHFYGHALQ